MKTEGKLVGALRAFDSHERGILLQWAAGASFGLSDELGQQLHELIPSIQVPERAFVAMDYTLDWLYAAVLSYTSNAVTGPQPWPLDGRLRASIEDIDLVIAWEDEGGAHLLLLEAKGFTGWSNKQLLSKVKRLSVIFDDAVRAGVDVHLVLVGPRKSTGIKTEAWPDWLHKDGRYHFLPITDPGARYAVQRCNAVGQPMSEGWTHWQVVPRKWTSDEAAGQ